MRPIVLNLEIQLLINRSEKNAKVIYFTNLEELIDLGLRPELKYLRGEPNFAQRAMIVL